MTQPRPVQVISGCTTDTSNCTVILEAGGNSIGASDNLVTTHIDPNGSLIARARDSIYIQQVEEDLRLDVIYAPNLVSISNTNGSLLDAYDDENLNIKTNVLRLAATGSIGASGNPIEIDLSNTSPLTVTTAANVYLYELIGNMLVDNVTATHTVSLRADQSILDYESGITAKIFCDDLILVSNNYGLGSHLNELHIDTHRSGIGTLTATGGGGDVLINEMSGDLYINTVDMSKGGVAYILSVGSIYNGHAADDTSTNILGGYVRLYAANGIGLSTHPLQSTIGYLDGYANNGSSYLHNYGHLNVGWTGDPMGFRGNGDIVFSASSPITVIQNTTAYGNLTLIATDDDNLEADDIWITAGYTVKSETASVYLYAGDNFLMDATAKVIAANNVYIYIDANCTSETSCPTPFATPNLDAAGGTLTIYSPYITAQGLYIYGNEQADSVTMNGAITVPYLEIQMREGNDTVNLLNSLQAANALINLGDGDDTFLTNTIGDYATHMDVYGGLGNDHFTFTSVNGDMDVDGEAGTDLFDVEFVTTATSDVNLNGGDDSDTFVIHTNGADPALTISMDGNNGNDLWTFYNNWGQIDAIRDTGTDSGLDTLDFHHVTYRVRFIIGNPNTSDPTAELLLITQDVATADTDAPNPLSGVANTAIGYGNTIENLIGGTESDSFNFMDGAILARNDQAGSATINGYAGTADLINYTEYTSAVTVDLSKQIATGVGLLTDDSINKCRPY